MDDETPTSPPGSWPAGSETGVETSDVIAYTGSESPAPENVEKGLSKDKGKDTKISLRKGALLPPEILEQYAKSHISNAISLTSIDHPYSRKKR